MGQEKLRLLVVDDNPDHAVLMTDALRTGLDASVSSCASAREALKLVESGSPDAVVLDYRLPAVEGSEALLALRSRTEAPIIVVTGLGSESAAVEVLKAGAEDYLPKVTGYLSALPTTVLRAVHNSRRRREELAQLRLTSQALSESLDLQGVVEAALDGVISLLRPEAAWLLLPSGRGALELVGARGCSREVLRNPESRFESSCSQPVIVKDEDRPGLLCAGATKPGRFALRHRELLSTVASHTASAVQNARLFAKVAQGKAQWERTFDSISDPIIISDSQFHILRLNRAAARCFNLSVRQAPGLICHQLLLGSEQPCPWHDALYRGVPVSSDRFLSQLQRWFCFSAFPFEGNDGHPVGVVHVLRDITDERQMRQQIAQSQKLAALGELVAGVAHELNNPLTGILGFSQLLLPRVQDASLKEDLEKIAGEARRATRIVRNLSTFARQQPLSRRLVDINSLLQKVLDLRSYQLNVAAVQVTPTLAEDLPRILADPDGLQQVFLNLMNNAEHAMADQKDPKQLTITTRLAPNDRLCIEFRDTGHGLREEACDRIFDPFFTTKEAGRGTGLGLSVCYGIVQEHGGKIFAANHPDGGAVLTVELPLDNRGALKGEQEGDAEPASAPPPSRLLVVDDEPVIADLVQRTLSEAGHQVTTAENGGAALARLAEGEYDLIICDLKLPDMSGQQCYHRLLEEAPHMKGRFIFLTGDTLGRETTEFLHTNPGPWLEKPLLPEDLKHVVHKHLSSRVMADG